MASTDGMQRHLFTSESVSMGHPDKLADQISDAILDSLILHDPQVRTAIETLVTTGLVVVAGEVTVHNDAAEQALGRAEETVRATIRQVGYDDSSTGFDYRSCAVLRALHGQSADISQGVTAGAGLHTEPGAGDQGLMFGFACNETKALMPLPAQLARQLLDRMTELRESGEIPWLRPDAKSQVTVQYDDGKPMGLDTIVLSTQHTEEAVDSATGNMSKEARQTLVDSVIRPVVQKECPQFWSESLTLHINPTGRFIIGVPPGDAGSTGRKIIVDTYGGRGRHGGGAFSGKDPSKVDRSATYMTRYVAKNIVAAGLADQCELQLAYAIGVAEPVSILIDSFGTGTVSDLKLQEIVRATFPLTPREIINALDLQRPIYLQTARRGHFGIQGSDYTWEKTDRIDELRRQAECPAMAAGG